MKSNLRYVVALVVVVLFSIHCIHLYSKISGSLNRGIMTNSKNAQMPVSTQEEGGLGTGSERDYSGNSTRDAKLNVTNKNVSAESKMIVSTQEEGELGTGSERDYSGNSTRDAKLNVTNKNVSAESKMIVSTQEEGELGTGSERDYSGNSTRDAKLNVTNKNVSAESKFDLKLGVLPSYISILQEAYRRADEDISTGNTRGKLGRRGVVIGPTEGHIRHTVKALQNARRIRTVLGLDKSVKIALMTSESHIHLLHNCVGPVNKTRFKIWNKTMSSEEKNHVSMLCKLWANGTVLDDLLPTIDNEYKHNDNNTNTEQGSSFNMMKNMASYVHGPYVQSLFLDTDAYPCPGFPKLFSLVKNTHLSKAFKTPITGNADVAIGLEQYSFDPRNGAKHFCPGNPDKLQDWFTFNYRNDGVVLFHYHRKISNVFAHFIPLISEHVYNHVASPTWKIVNDQTPFNIALYLFHRLVPEFVETVIPQHSSCRSYPGKKYAGIDGFLNGMLPIQQDGKPCRECRCSPCLISHFASAYRLELSDRKYGWEDNLTGIDIQGHDWSGSENIAHNF